MVIARVAAGKSVDSVQQTQSTFRIADVETGQQTSVATRPTGLPLQTQPGHGEIQELDRLSQFQEGLECGAHLICQRDKIQHLNIFIHCPFDLFGSCK